MGARPRGATLQGVLQQLLDMGVVSTLSEDLQWNIRMLLPRQVWTTWSHPCCARLPAQHVSACKTNCAIVFLAACLHESQVALLVQKVGLYWLPYTIQVPGGRAIGMRPDGQPPSSIFGPPTCSNAGGGSTMSGGLPPPQPQASHSPLLSLPLPNPCLACTSSLTALRCCLPARWDVTMQLASLLNLSCRMPVHRLRCMR